MRRRRILSSSLLLSKVPQYVGLLPLIILCIFTVRRWLFTLVSVRSRHLSALSGPEAPNTNPYQQNVDEPEKTVLLLVSFRDEAATLPGLLQALQRLDFPDQHLQVVFVDDGSRDGGATLCANAVQERPNWHLLHLPQSQGKAAALHTALTRFEHGDLIAIFDADERPRPGALQCLVAACRDPRVAAVSGRRALSNSLASPTASYVAFENMVHQLLTQQAKDRLGLAPAILGSNCLYRRHALVQVGGFRAGALLEDSDLTVRLVCAGWQTRYTPHAVAEHAAPQQVSAYWRQHVRWAGGFQQVTQSQASTIWRAHSLPWTLRLELLLFSLGYVDRAALAATVAIALLGDATRLPARLSRRVLPFALITPLVQIILTLQLDHAPRQLWMRLPLSPVYFIVDMLMALVGIGRSMMGRPIGWERRVS